MTHDRLLNLLLEENCIDLPFLIIVMNPKDVIDITEQEFYERKNRVVVRENRTYFHYAVCLQYRIIRSYDVEVGEPEFINQMTDNLRFFKKMGIKNIITKKK